MESITSLLAKFTNTTQILLISKRFSVWAIRVTLKPFSVITAEVYFNRWQAGVTKDLWSCYHKLTTIETPEKRMLKEVNKQYTFTKLWLFCVALLTICAEAPIVC